MYIVLKFPLGSKPTQEDADGMLSLVKRFGFNQTLEDVKDNFLKPMASEAGASVTSIQDAVLRGKGIEP
jgi:hypothetical protein